MSKIIFIDFDNTLFSHYTNQIPDSAVEAIKLARKNGHKILICTGRSFAELFYFDYRDIQFDGYILSNGQMISDKDLKTIYVEYVEPKDKLVELFNLKQFPITISDEKRIYANFINDYMRQVLKRIDSPIPEVREYDSEGIISTAFYFDNEEVRNKYVDELNKNYNIVNWGPLCITVINDDVDKANGIKKLLEMQNIDINNTIGIGDGDNDIGMVKFCNIGIAMGNSIDALKNVADYVTDHIDENGIFNAFKHFGLI